MATTFTLIMGNPITTSLVWRAGSDERVGVCYGRVHRSGCAHIQRETGAMRDVWIEEGSPEELAWTAVGDWVEPGQNIRVVAKWMVICPCCGDREAWINSIAINQEGE